MTRPNVVFILVDDMGYGDFSAFNGGVSYTPRLDALMGEGVCLTQHYAASAVCNPSRAALMTGRYPHRTGSIDTLEGRGLDRLATREVTVADAFRTAGYATGLIGKWHLGAFDPRYHPNRRGFEEFLGFRGGWSDYRRWRLDANGSPVRADGRYLTDVFADGAVSFIERHRGEPFFLHVCFNAPHAPLQAPEPDVQRFAKEGKVSYPVSVLYGMIHRMDSAVERILGALDSASLTGNTIVVFTSDNGPQFGSELGSIERFNCNFNGCKGRVYEGGIRVPAIVRWPAGGLSGGRTVREFVHMTDWCPTLCGMAGIAPPSARRLDGEDVRPALRGEARNVNPRRFWQWNRYTPLVTTNAAMRDGPWKLVRPWIKEAFVVSDEDLRRDRAMRYDPDSITDIVREADPARSVPPPGSPELYHIDSDPEERRNLAAEQPERASRMLRELETWFEEVEAERRTIAE